MCYERSFILQRHAEAEQAFSNVLKFNQDCDEAQAEIKACMVLQLVVSYCQ